MAPYIIYTSDERHKDIRLVGGKAYSLWQLKTAGFNIPTWFVVPSNVIEQYPNGEFPAEILDEIEKAFSKLISQAHSRAVAVRSSGVHEDSTDASFAGQFATVLAVADEQQLEEALQKVIASSQRATTYIQSREISADISLAVVVQVMIDSAIAGVAFSRESSDEHAPVLISAAHGLGSGVVQGEVPTDTYTVDVAKKYIHEQLIPGQQQAALSKGQILELANLVKKIEQSYGAPQDIEWALKDGIFYILQSRPITHYPRSQQAIWDNSNIAESYTGVTLPLTASFARHVYEVVYTRVLRTSGISEDTVFAHRRALKNLLGFPYGRFYYNLKNWYVLLSFFPAFRANKKFLEQMIGVPEDESYLPPPPSRLFSIWYLLRAFFRVIFFSRELKIFYTAFDEYYVTYQQKRSRKLTITELEQLYDFLQTQLLYRWHTPIDNDFLVMVFHGRLRKLAEQYGLLTTYPSLVNDLLTGLGGVISADQAQQLIKLSRLVQDNDELGQLFKQKQWKILKEKEAEFKDFHQALISYRQTFGERFANELKLESQNLSENPAALYTLIALYLTITDKELTERAASRDQTRAKAEEHISKTLSLMRRLLFMWVLRRARYHIKHREHMRLLRAQTFGAARYIFLSLAQHLIKQGVLSKEEDIFYLEIDEIFNFIDGSSTVTNLQELVNLRRKEYREYHQKSLSKRFSTRGIPYLDLPEKEVSVSAPQGALRGIGCSTGIVEGTAYVMIEFEPEADIPHDAILITRHTDPGWIPVFSYVRGIIVEYGGLLSHAAIVSRELGIPCIVGVPGATQSIKTGDRIHMNGTNGRISISAKGKL